MNNMVRIIVIDISNVLGSEIYDEALFPIEETENVAKFIQQYTDIRKYRIITV